MKYSKYVKIWKSLNLIFNKVNEYSKEIDVNKKLALVPTNESNEKNKRV